jgi:hypothetical protein
VIAVAVLAACIASALIGAFVSTRFSRNGRQLRATRTVLAQHRQFIERLRETAWLHREVDPSLSAVLVDEIRIFTLKHPEITP